jgi:hypothetical protein
MRPLFDDLDEFDFDDSPMVARLLREQRREATRRASRRSNGPKHHLYDDFDEDPSDYGGYGDSQAYDEDSSDEYGDYDEQEFDLHAGIGREH